MRRSQILFLLASVNDESGSAKPAQEEAIWALKLELQYKET